MRKFCANMHQNGTKPIPQVLLASGKISVTLKKEITAIKLARKKKYLSIKNMVRI